MILGPSPIPETRFNSLTQRVCELMKKAHNHHYIQLQRGGSGGMIIN